MRLIVLMLAVSSLFTSFGVAQDESQSLGDVARQSRQQKQKTVQPKTAKISGDQPKAARVITSEELPQHAGTASSPQHEAGLPATSATATAPATGTREEQGQQIKEQIQSQKEAVASLQEQIKQISESIQYAGPNCVTNCVQWNERQKQKQDEVEGMKVQLADQQKKLEEMQEAARKQGFGSSIYEP